MKRPTLSVAVTIDHGEPRPTCRECGREIDTAKWHHKIGWVYVQHCSDCREPVCANPLCSEADCSDESSYVRCTRCVVHRREHGCSWDSCCGEAAE